MMKRGWIYMFMVLGIMTGCVDKSYGGMEDEEIFDDTTEPILVKIHIGSAETIVSKGSGVIADVTEWKGEKFYVYAFRNDMNATYNVTSKTNSSHCLIDGSKDVPGTRAGKQAYMRETSNMVAWTGPDERVYYPYGLESGIVYDFFAYYVDDIEVEEGDITRDTSRVTILVEIDGTQDLMSSKAKVTADQWAGFEEYDEQEKLLLEHYCYSYHAARKGIDPVFVFKHHLTKLNFKLTPAHNMNGKRTVTVKRIEVRSRNTALFTVADRANADNLGLVFSDGDKYFANMPVREEDGSDLKQDTYKVETLESPTSKKRSIDIGSSLMVAPSESYEAYAYLTETFLDGTSYEYPEPLLMELKTPGGFLPGNGYTINISVYGATRVETDVELVPWNDGGKVDVDYEDAFGNDGEY